MTLLVGRGGSRGTKCFLNKTFVNRNVNKLAFLKSRSGYRFFFSGEEDLLSPISCIPPKPTYFRANSLCYLTFFSEISRLVAQALDIFETPTGPPDPRSPKTPQQQKKEIPKTPKTPIIPKSRRSFPKSRRSFPKTRRPVPKSRRSFPKSKR